MSTWWLKMFFPAGEANRLTLLKSITWMRRRKERGTREKGEEKKREETGETNTPRNTFLSHGLGKFYPGVPGPCPYRSRRLIAFVSPRLAFRCREITISHHCTPCPKKGQPNVLSYLL